MSIVDTTFWYCNQCEYGFFLDTDFDSDTWLECVRCKHRIDNCQTCEEDQDFGLRCLTCEFDLVPNVLTCDVETIPNCKKVSDHSEDICEECHWSYGRSPDG